MVVICWCIQRGLLHSEELSVYPHVQEVSYIGEFLTFFPSIYKWAIHIPYILKGIMYFEMASSAIQSCSVRMPVSCSFLGYFTHKTLSSPKWLLYAIQWYSVREPVSCSFSGLFLSQTQFLSEVAAICYSVVFCSRASELFFSGLFHSQTLCLRSGCYMLFSGILFSR
jgi:hypothetical protein